MRSPIWISAGVALALAPWLGTGTLSAGIPDDTSGPEAASSGADPESTAGKTARDRPEAQRVTVEVATSRARPVTREVLVQGELEPLRTVRVRAEVRGRVEKIEVEKGSRVEAGQVLVRLAPEDRVARLRHVRALKRQRKAELDAAKALGARGMQAATRVAAAEAEWESARAEEARLQLEMDWTRIQAPFAGLVQARPAEVGAFMKVGEVVAEIVDDSELIAAGEVPQLSAGQIRPGMTAKIRLLDGQELDGIVSYRAPVGDDGTRSFRVEVKCPNPDRTLAGGLSAELRIPIETVAAHLVPLSLLTLGPNGALGIKVVEAGDRVGFRPVRVVRTTNQGAWVTGLGETARLITLGQGFVRAGEPVRVMVREAPLPRSADSVADAAG